LSCIGFCVDVAGTVARGAVVPPTPKSTVSADGRGGPAITVQQKKVFFCFRFVFFVRLPGGRIRLEYVAIRLEYVWHTFEFVGITVRQFKPDLKINQGVDPEPDLNLI